MSDIKERIEHIEWMLKDYKDTWLEATGTPTENGGVRPRPTIVWPDKSNLGMGFASHMSGDPGGFKKLGFEGYYDFYKLPKEKRNMFLEKGLKIFKKIFYKNLEEFSEEELKEKYTLLLQELKTLADTIKKE